MDNAVGEHDGGESISAIGNDLSVLGGASLLFACHFVQWIDLYSTRFRCVFAFKVLISAKKVHISFLTYHSSHLTRFRMSSFVLQVHVWLMRLQVMWDLWIKWMVMFSQVRVRQKSPALLY